MGKREKLRAIWGGRSKSPRTSAVATSAPSPLGSQAIAATTDSVVTPANDEKNKSLQIAIEKHLAELPDIEKGEFRRAAQQFTSDNIVLDRVASYDEEHKNKSRFRPCAPHISRFLHVVNRLLNGVSIGVQANPDISAIIVGAVRGLIDVALGFVQFFDKLTSLISRLSDLLGPLAVYAESSEYSNAIRDCLAEVYADVLRFCWLGRRVFVDENGCTREFVSWRIFWRVQWKPFEAEFGGIEADLKHHLQMLGHTTAAIDLKGSLENSRMQRQRLSQEKNEVREKFLMWLSNEHPEDTHDKIYAKKHLKTSDWILRDFGFQRWYSRSDSALLWCYGKAGAGKSVIASNVIEHITSKCALDPTIGIAFAYYDYRAPAIEDVAVLVNSLLKQLCREMDAIPASFQETKSKALSPLQLGNAQCLVSACQQYQQQYIIIDALDECSKSERPSIIGLLNTLMIQLPCLKIFVTSRREADIETAFASCSIPRILVEARSTTDDIALYVSDEVQQLRSSRNGVKLYLQDDSLQQKIINFLTEKADGMFLWVQLQLRSLCEVSECQQDTEVEKALNTMPIGLEQTYIRILANINQQIPYKRDLAIKALRWVLYAPDMLSTEVLEELLWTEMPMTSRMVGIDVVIAACGNLIEYQYAEFRFVRVRFLHYSVQEFLSSPVYRAASNLVQCELARIDECYATLAIACIKILLLAQPDDSILHPETNLPSEDNNFHSALRYAAVHFDHFLARAMNVESEALDLAIRLVNRDAAFLAGLLQMRLDYQEVRFLYSMPYIDDAAWSKQDFDPRLFILSTQLCDLPQFNHLWKDTVLPDTSLHASCSGGLDRAVRYLLEGGADINMKNTNGRTPLSLATLYGHLNVVEILIAHCADINAIAGVLGTPLQIAVEQSNDAIARRLLHAGADVNIQGGIFHTALQAAASAGGIAMVRTLLDAGADVHAQGGKYHTALQAGASTGSSSIVRLLLDAGADVDAQGGRYHTALQAGASSGNIEIVHMLLDAGADVNVQGGAYHTALQTGVSVLNVDIVHALLNAGADVHPQGGLYHTALQAAARYMNPQTLENMRMLLDAGADVNVQNPEGKTALHIAMETGGDEVVKMLLKAGADTNICDARGRNALDYARRYKRTKMKQILLENGAREGAKDDEKHRSDEPDVPESSGIDIDMAT